MTVRAVFIVAGIPAPKGSMKNWGGAITHSNKNTKPWQGVVQYHAMQKKPKDAPFTDCAIAVSLTFYMPTPKTVDRDVPWVPPDIDKLTRTILDALTGIFYKDDSQVCDLIVKKRYDRATDGPGVLIEVEAYV